VRYGGSREVVGRSHAVVQARVLWSVAGPEVTDCEVGR
jgi:hypothetical protein